MRSATLRIVKDHSGEQSGIFRGLASTRGRVVAGCVCIVVAVVVLLAVPWVARTLELHIVVPVILALFGFAFFGMAIAFRRSHSGGG
jgi:hypothetical protein